MGANHPLEAYRKSYIPEMSRAFLAERLGVSRITVHRWEKGERKIDADRVVAVSEKTGIPVRELRPDLVELLGDRTPEQSEAAR